MSVIYLLKINQFTSDLLSSSLASSSSYKNLQEFKRDRVYNIGDTILARKVTAVYKEGNHFYLFITNYKLS